MTDEVRPRGHLTREATAWCGCCDVHRQESGGLSRRLARMGWRYTRRFGWVCPKCSRALRWTVRQAGLEECSRVRRILELADHFLEPEWASRQVEFDAVTALVGGGADVVEAKNRLTELRRKYASEQASS